MDTSELFSLKGKCALVTGGFGNLGPNWVNALIRFGAYVAILDLNSASKPDIYNSFPRGKFKIYSADVTDNKSLKTVHKLIKKESGNISILVNNAGIDSPPLKNDQYATENSEDIHLKMWKVNVQGIVNCIEEFSKDMVSEERGSIINIGSLYLERSPYEGLYTHLNFDKPWVYGATKAAVHQITRHFATRLAKHNVRVNTLSPGGVLGNQDKEFIRKFTERTPLGRMADKEQDLIGPLVFLASNASGYVTGINLQVNGGYTAW